MLQVWFHDLKKKNIPEAWATNEHGCLKMQIKIQKDFYHIVRRMHFRNYT